MFWSYRVTHSPVYSFTMTFGPQLSEKETLFIPAGWDSPDKLAIENVDAQEPGTLVDFNSVISKPAQTVNEEVIFALPTTVLLLIGL